MLRHSSLATLTIAAAAITACASHTEHPPAAVGTILFVCEHGNVKSLMAASYFNDLARERNVGVRAMSRAAALDSVTVPTAIVAGLKDDGFDVAEFRPIALSAVDVAASQRVIVISTALPAGADVRGKTVESWNDVPAASVDYAAARNSLKAHVSQLVAQLQAVGDP
jgi:arsenate reductase